MCIHHLVCVNFVIMHACACICNLICGQWCRQAFLGVKRLDLVHCHSAVELCCVIIDFHYQIDLLDYLVCRNLVAAVG